jgi:hypothetical protein
MTAINALKYGDAAYLLTDTASYLDTGLVVGFSSKTVTLPHLNMALAVSGAVQTQDKIIAALMPFGSFEEVIEEIPALLRGMWEAGAFEVPGEDDPGLDTFRVFMIGHCSNGPGVHALSTQAEPSLEPFTWRFKGIIMSPSLSLGLLEERGLYSPTCGYATRDPSELLPLLVDVQRSLPRGRKTDDKDVFVIGGAAVLTKIDASGISQRVVRRWPDRVDEFIQPAVPHTGGTGSMDTGSKPLPLGNRAQRRALKSAQRGGIEVERR